MHMPYQLLFCDYLYGVFFRMSPPLERSQYSKVLDYAYLLEIAHTIVKILLARSCIAAPQTDEKLAVAIRTFDWGFHRAEQLGTW